MYGPFVRESDEVERLACGFVLWKLSTVDLPGWDSLGAAFRPQSAGGLGA